MSLDDMAFHHVFVYILSIFTLVLGIRDKVHCTGDGQSAESMILHERNFVKPDVAEQWRDTLDNEVDLFSWSKHLDLDGAPTDEINFAGIAYKRIFGDDIQLGPLDILISPLIDKVTAYVQWKSIRPIAFGGGFLRRYGKTTRNEFAIHTDKSELSVIVAVSDPCTYEGGNFYMYNRKQTKRLKKQFEKDNPRRNITVVRQWVEDNKSELPYINVKQGDFFLYRGDLRFHGVTPVTEGVRFSIVLFFDTVHQVTKEIMQKKKFIEIQKLMQLREDISLQENHEYL